MFILYQNFDATHAWHQCIFFNYWANAVAHLLLLKISIKVPSPFAGMGVASTKFIFAQLCLKNRRAFAKIDSLRFTRTTFQFRKRFKMYNFVKNVIVLPVENSCDARSFCFICWSIDGAILCSAADLKTCCTNSRFCRVWELV